MNATLIMLALASTPDAVLLEKLGARALQLETFSNASRMTVDIVAEELNGDGAVKKMTYTALRVGRTGARVERKLLTYQEDGKDLTEDKRAELEKPPPKKGAGAVQSPFHPDQRAKYQFTVLGSAADQPGLLRLGFQPAGEKSEDLYVGEATVDPESGDTRSLSLRPSKFPAFVDSFSLEARLDAPTPAGRAMSRLSLKGVAGLLFLKKHFRVVTTFTDYEALEPRFVEANGLRFGYLEWGQGPLVLAVHGFPDTPHTWDVIGPALAASGFRVVAPFTRGYAPSGMPASDPTTLELGQDTVALISALGAQKAHLLGHDWGAEAVNAAVALGPQQVLTLTTIGIPHRAAVAPTPKLGWALRHFFTLRLPGAEARFARDDFAQLEMFIRRWSPTWRFTAEDLAPIKQSFRQPGTVHGALGYYRAASALLPAFMKARIAVPTLNIAGADDPGVAPATYEATRSHYTGPFSVCAVPGGHFCHRESPAALLPHLLSHLAAARP